MALEIISDLNVEMQERGILQLTEAQQFMVCAAVEGMLEAIKQIKMEQGK